MGQRRNHSKIRKYLAMDDNEITTYQNVYNAVKAVDTEMYCLNKSFGSKVGPRPAG